MYFLIEFNFQARFRFTENWMSSTASSCIPSAHTCVQPAHYQHPAPEWYICYNRWTYTQHYQIVQCMLVHSCCWSLWVSRCMVTSSTIVEPHTIVSLTDLILLSSQNLGNYWSLLFDFPQMSQGWENIIKSCQNALFSLNNNHLLFFRISMA